MQQTDKYKLNKPGEDDPIAIAPLNENMDKVEGALEAQDARITMLEAKYMVFGTYVGDGQRPGLYPRGGDCPTHVCGVSRRCGCAGST